MPKYYPINEDATRRAKNANSFSDYVPGSATAAYREMVDRAYTLGKQQKGRVDPMYHEKIDGLIDRYARKLAENINQSNLIDARVPSILIAGGSNFPVRKKEKQNAARDKNMGEYMQIEGLLDKVRSTGRGGISADDDRAVEKLEAKLAGLEAMQEEMKTVNAYYRKHKTLEGCPVLSAEEIGKLQSSMASDWRKNPVPYDANKKPIGEYTSDDEGYIYIDEIPGGLSGRFYLRELEAAPGYTLDKQYKTVYVSPGKTVEIEWENTAVTGQIQIYKYAAEYNEVTGTAAGTPLKGAVYEIVNVRSGKVVDYITTDARGVAASKPLPLTRYQIREVTAPAYWQLDPTVHDVTLEYPGQIIKLSAYDKPSSLGVTITKRGNAQVMAGQSMRYDLTVANTSNVPLESFFWHDKIPYDVARPTTLTTGTYSARLNYRILYKTNYNASYQVLASNLLTGNNYSFSLNAIPMQAGEVVTDIYFDFGKVPVGFQSVVNPTLSVMVNGNAVNGYQMVNRADVGGKYQGTWQTAAASWVTIIRRLWNTPTLPKTGY